MKLKKGPKRIVLIIVILLILIGFIFTVVKLTSNKNKVGVSKVVNEIGDYGYQLKDNKSKLYKEKFKELKEILEQEEVDKEEYAKKISEIFIIDFYTLDDKIAKTDIGGVDFVYSDEREDFIKKAMDTVYKYVESNLYDDRNQELPIVSNVQVNSIENISFEYLNNVDNSAYKVNLTWDYKKDMGYESEATLIIVHEDNKLSIVEMD